jgi:hypothetical protein
MFFVLTGGKNRVRYKVILIDISIVTVRVGICIFQRITDESSPPLMEVTGNE